MNLKYLAPFMFALTIGVIGCASHQVDMAGQEPRPLGEEFPSYQQTIRICYEQLEINNNRYYRHYRSRFRSMDV